MGTVNSAVHTRTRIGFIGDEENGCTEPDSFIGIGCPGPANRHFFDLSCGVSNVTNTCGNSATCSPDNGDKEIKAMGYIFVR